MSECFRDSEYQYCDTTRYLVLDSVTGEFKDFVKEGVAQGKLFEFQDFLKAIQGSERMVAIKVECIQGFKLPHKKKIDCEVKGL